MQCRGERERGLVVGRVAAHDGFEQRRAFLPGVGPGEIGDHRVQRRAIGDQRRMRDDRERRVAIPRAQMAAREHLAQRRRVRSFEQQGVQAFGCRGQVAAIGERGRIVQTPLERVASHQAANCSRASSA